MRKSASHFAAFACSFTLVAAAHALLCAPVHAQQEWQPQSPPQHVQPGQLAQSTLPQPTKLVTRGPSSKPAIDATSLSDAATKIAIALEDFHAKRVAVLDFAMPQDAEWNRVGQKLANDFRANLAEAAPGVEQLSREEVAKYMKHYNLAQEDLPIPGVAAHMLEKSTADAWLATGITFDLGSNRIVLNFTAHAADPHGDYANVNLPVDVTPDLAALVDPPAPNPLHDLTIANMKAGVKPPSCERCTVGEYTDEAVKASLQGTIYLIVAIDATGVAKQIYVVKGLPFGLTQSAIDSVRGWRFQPALGPDGQPTEVTQTVEVTYRLF